MNQIESHKSLIAYFSRAGNNYVNGKIVNLVTGNTRRVADKILVSTGSDLFEIQTNKSYPEDYDEATRVSKIELREKARPELKNPMPGIDQYDLIYLGYPNWWGTMPMAVFTFLELYDFSGKTIRPFCTHEGSGLGKSVTDIKNRCPSAQVLSGLSIWGWSVDKADQDIAQWIIDKKSTI